MKGVVKLKVPQVVVKPKLFILILQKPNDIQRRFIVVHHDLGEAVNTRYYNGYTYKLSDYVTHVELTVDEINSKFKSYNP
jgi:hypothetical protein